MKLPDNEVHVWWSQPHKWSSEGVTRAALAVLSDDEQARYHRFLFDPDREIFLSAHALKRGLLGRYLDCEADALRFDVGEYGRPELRGVSGLRFNITHTRGLVACVVHDERDCGVDAEWRGRTPDLPALTKRCFVPEEIKGIDAQPKPLHRFFELWTLKEAYIKARGMGMALPLHGFWFVGAGSPAKGFGARGDVEPSPDRWTFELFSPTEEHQLAVAICADEGAERGGSLSWRHILPASLGFGDTSA